VSVPSEASGSSGTGAWKPSEQRAERARGIPVANPVGFVDFDRVWLDDRRRCTWGLCDVSFVVEPGQTVAIVSPVDHGAADSVLDLLSGRRLPVRGRVSIDGVDLRDFDRVSHLRALTAEYGLDSGERRLRVGGRTTLVAGPTAATLAAADLVITVVAGYVVASERPARAAMPADACHAEVSGAA
jgi:hypothetical protein